MMRKARKWLACVALAICATVAGCDAQQAPGTAQTVVTLPQSLSASDITRVELTVSAEGMAPRTVALVKTGGQWGGVVGSLPAGGGHTFSAQAFDAANTLIYAGQVTDVTITTDQTTAVTLVLQEVNAPAPFENAAPMITSVVASRATVRPGGVVVLQAAAQDANAGDSLTYAWTAGAGSFSAAGSLSTEWTAPATSGPVVVTLTVTDSKGATAALSLTLTVSDGTGSAAVNVTVNTWPQVTRVNATPSTVAVGEATTVVATASDNDGDSLGYQWTAGCAGTWANATSASASFTPTAQPPAGSLCASCALTVTVVDGRDGQTTGTLSVCVGPRAQARFAPDVVEAFQSSATMPSSGGTVDFRVMARDGQGSALTFSWEANVGTLGTATNTATTSEVVWTAPACVPEGTTPTVNLTVTNALGLSASASFTLQGATTCLAFAGSRLAAGTYHTAAVRQDGTVWAWGSNGFGQLGDGTAIQRLIPVQVQELTNIVVIAAGDNHTVALRRDGTVWTWGRNDSGQLGDGSTTRRSGPVRVPGLTGVVAIAAGLSHSVAVRQDGTVWAWGNNGFGQVGDGTTSSRTFPVQVPGLTGVKAIAAGTYHSAALRQDGTVWAWGFNGLGRLGDGTVTNRSMPVQAQGLTGVTVIAAGSSHTAAVRQDGTVWTWGSNDSGQLGDETSSFRLTPAQVQGFTGATALAVGSTAAHTVAVRQDGTVWAWGLNTYGQLGDGTTARHATPIQVQGFMEGTSVVAGAYHTVAVRQDGTVWAWGRNWEGQLGDGTSSYRLAPVQMQGLTGGTAIAAGHSHTVALRQDGTAWAWGRNSNGQLGDGTTADRALPVQVQGVTAVSAIAAGDNTTVVVSQDGILRSWGYNAFGQSSATGYMAAAGGSAHTVAVRQDGSVWGWGLNTLGQLGWPAGGSGLFAEAQVQGVTEVTAVAAGFAHTVVLRQDGTVWAWGLNSSGQLGDGTTTNRSSPVQVQGLTGITAIVAGDYHTMALRQDGTVWAWGFNAFGQLGNRTTADVRAPVQVQGLTGITAIAAGTYHTVTLGQDGTVWTWGLNSSGQLGEGTTTNRTIPMQVTMPGSSPVIALAAGAYHTVVLRQDGTGWAWGFNSNGQLANGRPSYQFAPVQVQGLTVLPLAVNGPAQRQ